jgi:hypothetical protein
MADETKKIVKTIFCANEQKETPHVLSASGDGEIVATCDCGRFLKFPKGIDKATFDDLVAKHKTSNEGQVTQESIDKNLSALADDEIGVETKETPAE